jgi:CTP:molybdopterin cytidylyltransferase MocA
LRTGLKLVTPGHSCFFQNIDNPFVSGETLDKMISFNEKADVVKPCFGEKSGHPVLVGPTVIRAIIAEADFTHHIDAFLRGYTLLKVDIQDARILTNINQPADYGKAGF